MTTETRRRRRSRLLSMRARVTLVATAAVAVVLVLVSLELVELQTQSSTRQLDEILSDEAEAISHAIALGGPIPILFDEDRVVAVVTQSGELVASNGPIDGLVDLGIRTREGEGVNARFAGDHHRVVTEAFTRDDGTAGIVFVAEPRGELDESVERLVHSLMWVIPLTVVVLMAILWFVVGFTLRPVERIRSEVAALGARDLGRRVSVPPGDDEITRLADTMNDMLDRLEDAAGRQRQFVSDAAHELRTPLARMRAELEADQLSPARADTDATRRSQLDEITSLQVLIDDMLLLARSDDGKLAGPFEVIDLDDIVFEEVTGARSSAPSNVDVDVSGVSSAQVSGVVVELQRVVRNLVDNALHHGATRVAIRLTEAEAVMLSIDDDGPGVPADRRSEVFERFRRLDSAHRARGERNQGGLGLAIVADLVRRHGGTITVDDSQLGGARFVVRLPAAEPAPSTPLPSATHTRAT